MEEKDTRVLLTKRKIESRLYKNVQSRITFAWVAGALGIVCLAIAAIIIWRLYVEQNPSFGLFAVMVGVTLVCAAIVAPIEIYKLRKQVRRIKQGCYQVLHDYLIRVNEKMKPIHYYPLNTSVKRHEDSALKDEFLFESGITHVRNSYAPDEFGLDGIMHFSDEPIPFLIVVYDENPTLPILLYDERIYRYQETETKL